MGQVGRAAAGVVEDLEELLNMYPFADEDIPRWEIIKILDSYEEQTT